MAAADRAPLPLSLSSDDESDSGTEGMRVNKRFAREYAERKTRALDRETVSTMAAEAAASDSSSEDEDDLAEALTPGLDLQIMRTIKMIREKDPRIYDDSAKFYSSESSGEDGEEEDDDEPRHKPQTFNDVQRAQVLAGGGDSDSETERPSSPSYAQAQADARASFLSAAAAGSDDEDDGDDPDMLRVRSKKPAELAREEQAFRAFVEEERARAEREGDDADKFLAEYSAQRQWIVPSLSDDEEGAAGPVAAAAEQAREQEQAQVQEDEDEEAAEAQREEFERQYNFRFQEEGAAVVNTYSRDVQGSMRRVDDSRKQKRAARRERKALERQRKEQELRRLRNLKKKEILDKLERIKDMSGLEEAGFDLDAEWDPAAHEAEMARTFGEDYYEAGVEDDWQPGEDPLAGLAGPEDDAAAPAAAEPEPEPEPEPAQADDDDGDGDDEPMPEAPDGSDEWPSHFSSVEEYEAAKQRALEELYKFDFEDMIGDMPTRFKYREVEPNDYGLTAEEILMADDKDLNQLVSLKKLAPYREREWQVPTRKLKKWKQRQKQQREEAEARALKRKAGGAVSGSESESEPAAAGGAGAAGAVGAAGAAGAAGTAAAEPAAAPEPAPAPAAADQSSRSARRKRRKKKLKDAGVSSARLSSYQL